MKKLFTLIVALVCTLCINAADYEKLYLVGDATPADWRLDGLDKTTMNLVSANVYEWTGILTNKPSGEGFKILTQAGWNPALHPSSPGLLINEATNGDVVSLPYEGDPDTKWKVSETAEYTVRVTFRATDVLVECIKKGDLDLGLPCVEGVYQISTATHAANFAKGINEGTIDNACTVVLTQDLDLQTIDKWVAIGTDAKKFVGTFDGQGHRIKNLHIDGTKKEQGFFGVIGAGAKIKNTIIDASCVVVSTGEACIAAFAGCCNLDGTITFSSCGNEAAVVGKAQNNAAFVGCNYGPNCKLLFENCYNTGAISGGWENGAFSGWCGGGATFINCWNSGAVTEGETWARGSKTVSNCYQTVGNDDNVNHIDASLLASGELCYKLNGKQETIVWYQNLTGETVDAHPVIDATHAQVYANGELNCDGSSVEGGTLTYSNTNESQKPDHDFDNGWCQNCHELDVEYLTPVEGVYTISSMNDLCWVSDFVAAGNQDIKIALGADIEQSSEVYTPIGTEAKPYKGNFDGKFHSVELNLENYETYNRQGLFGTLSGDAIVANVIVKGYVGAKDYAGGIAGAVQNAGTVLFERCGNEAVIQASGTNAGGIVGCNFSGKVVVRNCYNVAEIDGGRESAAISGWLGNDAVVENTYNAGEVTKGVDGTKTFARWGSGTYTNCYNTMAANTLAGRTDSYEMSKVASGELCYQLNGQSSENVVWYQTLDEDEYPVFLASHKVVYFDGENLSNSKPWTSAFEDGVAYTISANKHNHAPVPYLQDNNRDDVVDAHDLNENSYWVFIPTENENCYYIKNLATERYIQQHGTAEEVAVTMGTEPAEYCVLQFANEENAWGLCSTNNENHSFTAGCVALNLKGEADEADCWAQTFKAQAGTNHRSFWKIEKTSLTTAIEAVNTDVKVAKAIVNGQVVILRAGKMYNVAGAQMK